jgi:SAM-dependent methyltransferase
MLEIDKFSVVTSKDLEGLSWYEIASKLGLLSFNPQGNKPIELVIKIARITGSSTVLVVGCGAGGTAIHLAETTGAMVYGIDISPESIRTANTLASKSPGETCPLRLINGATLCAGKQKLQSSFCEQESSFGKKVTPHTPRVRKQKKKSCTS